MNEPQIQTAPPSQPNLRHNIKNQLTSLKALLELLKRNPTLDSQGKDYLLRMDGKLDDLHESMEKFFRLAEASEQR